MAINTYATLVSAVSEYLAREEDATLTARIPDFITLCEAKVNRALLHPKMETRTTLTVDTGLTNPEFLTMPTDYQTMRMVRLSGVTGKPRLSFLTQTQMEDYRYSIDNVSDQPVYWSLVSDAGALQMELAPTPNEDYAVQILYRANISALTSSNTTNWLLTQAPDLYLYGTLLEATPYTKNDARIAVWSSGFQTALDQLNIHGERQSFDGGPTDVRLPGVVP